MHPKMPDLFNKIRDKNIKIALNTGYNKEIQQSIIDRLNMTNFIDDYISSEEVQNGRPSPYMIQELRMRNNITTTTNIIKIGDTKNDILEGLNANCIASVGVLSGADSERDLTYNDPRSFIIKSVMDITPV